jgi:thiol-disulfide isomerase/thioredoxin
MRRLAYLVLPLLLLLPVLWVQGRQKLADAKDKTVEQQFEAILGSVQKEFENAQDAFRKTANAAERNQVQADFRKKLLTYSTQVLELVQKNPKETKAFEMARMGVRLLAESQDAGAADRLNELSGEKADANIRAAAMLGLAELTAKKVDSLGLKLAEAQKLSQEAEGLYEKVIKAADNREAVVQAKAQVEELRKFGIGRKAPEISGEDGDSKKFKLSDYKGKVVVIDFWAGWCGPCMSMVPHERQLVKRLEGKPFAFLGVCFDESKAEQKKAEEKHEIPWRSWFDGRSGSIGAEWKIESIPAVYVLDANGIIRFKQTGAGGHGLDDTVEVLLKEMQNK